MKPIRESSAAKKISTYVTLKDGEIKHIAHVYRARRAVQVDVWEGGVLVISAKDIYPAQAVHGHTLGGVQLFGYGYAHPKSAVWYAKAMSLKGVDRKYYAARLRKKHGVELHHSAFYYIAGLSRMESFGYKVIQVI